MDLAAEAANITKAGIDCPLGWPDEFAAFLAAWSSGTFVAPVDIAGKEWRRRLAYRRTDEVVRARLGLTARAAALGLTYAPDPSDAATAASEGWIALPASGLDALVP